MDRNSRGSLQKPRRFMAQRDQTPVLPCWNCNFSPRKRVPRGCTIRDPRISLLKYAQPGAKRWAKSWRLGRSTWIAVKIFSGCNVVEIFDTAAFHRRYPTACHGISKEIRVHVYTSHSNRSVPTLCLNNCRIIRGTKEHERGQP